MYLQSPEIFFRDCDSCKTYYYDRGTLLKGPDGKPLKRKGDLPKCDLCLKWDAETKSVWSGFTARNAYYFKTFLMAKAFGALPRPGGIDQQDPLDVEVLILLSETFAYYEELRSERASLRAIGRAAGGM